MAEWCPTSITFSPRYLACLNTSASQGSSLMRDGQTGQQHTGTTVSSLQVKADQGACSCNLPFHIIMILLQPEVRLDEHIGVERHHSEPWPCPSSVEASRPQCTNGIIWQLEESNNRRRPRSFTLQEVPMLPLAPPTTSTSVHLPSSSNDRPPH